MNTIAYLLVPVLMLSGLASPAQTNLPPLLANGGFEETDPTNAARPRGWDTLDGLGVRWETETNGNRIIRLDTAVSEKAYVDSCKAAGLEKWVFPNANGGPIAGTYGLSYYSDFFPAATGQSYRLTFRCRGSGGAKVWVRGYGMLRNEERRLYDTVVNCHGLSREWKTFSQCFHPASAAAMAARSAGRASPPGTPVVTRLRIMLYAYWPPGVYEFDDVTVVPVTEAEWEKDHRENE